MRTWLAGLISAMSGALAAAVGLLVADPVNFNFDTGLRKILIVCGFTAAVSLLNYLKQSPLPPGKAGANLTLRSFLCVVCVFSVLFLFSGCAGVTQQVGKIDKEAYQANKQLARDLLESTAFNVGCLDGAGLTNALAFPVKLENETEVRAFLGSGPLLLGISDLKAKAEKLKNGEGRVYWAEEDYDLGYTLCVRARIGFQSAVEGLNVIYPRVFEWAVKVLPALFP